MAEDPFHDMNPELVRRIQAFIAASEGRIRPGSGFRTYQEQARLYANYKNGVAGQARAAPPGRSNHNHGLAMDLQYSRDGAQWAQQNAARFGLHFPVPGENWHVEMVDDDGSRGAMRTAQSGGGLGFESIDTARDPEDELTHRLDSIMAMIGGGNVARKVAGTPEPALRTETTTVGGGQSAKSAQMGAAKGDKLANARLIAQIGRQMGAPDQAIKIALAAALVESGLENVDHGDRDSLGLFQQRPSQGWGTPQQVMDPKYAATQFYTRLLKLKNWQGMNPGAAAQAVQRSAYPDRYAKRWGEANSIFAQLGGL